jgi:hypothetical protein
MTQLTHKMGGDSVVTNTEAVLFTDGTEQSTAWPGPNNTFDYPNTIDPSQFTFNSGTFTWGVGATASVLSGNNNQFTVRITAGSSPTDQARWQFHFSPSGDQQPIGILTLASTTDATNLSTKITYSTNANSLAMQFEGTPVEGAEYTFFWVTCANN